MLETADETSVGPLCSPLVGVLLCGRVNECCRKLFTESWSCVFTAAQCKHGLFGLQSSPPCPLCVNISCKIKCRAGNLHAFVKGLHSTLSGFYFPQYIFQYVEIQVL